MGTYVFPASSRSHPCDQLNLLPPLAGLSDLEVGYFPCVEHYPRFPLSNDNDMAVLFQVSKVDLLFQNVVLCLVHHQMPKLLNVDVYIALG